jgi:hypothetical protein
MDLDQKISRLEARLRDLEDREQIRNAIAAYGPAVDSGDSAAAAELWAADGRYDVGGMGVSAGRESIIALFDGETHQGLIARGAAHVLSPLRIELEEDQATATGYSCVFTAQDGAFIASRVAANRWSLIRTGERWLVTERVNRLLDGSAEARDLLKSAP